MKTILIKILVALGIVRPIEVPVVAQPLAAPEGGQDEQSR